jgi:TonB-linked SusC/RagA family outer membrane protein
MRKTQLLVILIFIFQQFTFSQITITGTITSADDGMGLPGAAVYVKGTTNGTTADVDGKYKITVPSQGVTLVYSFVGLQPQEIHVSSQNTIDVVLKSDVFKMQEVVVAGVASATPKNKLSVSVSKIDSKELEDVPASSAATALQGKVAGVEIVSGNGNPGQSADIRLRGSNSLFEGQAPLIIIDGVTFDGEMADVNADDIASMEVVKGASASALYGSKAAAGVIVIHTKRGNFDNETTEIKIRNEIGQSGLLKEISTSSHNPYIVASDYNQPGFTKYLGVNYPANYQGGFNSNIQGTRTLDFDHYIDNPYSKIYDLQKQVFKPGLYYTNYASVSSNGKKTTFFTSFENNNNSGIIFNTTGSSRQNYKINVDHKINDYLKISTSTFISQNIIDMPSSSNDETVSHISGGVGSPFYNLLIMSPDVNLNVNGPNNLTLQKYYFMPDQWSNTENPKYSLYYEHRKETRKDLMQNFSSTYNPASWINFNFDYSFERQSSDFIKNDSNGYMSNGKLGYGYLYNSSSKDNSQTAQYTANLQGKFGDFTTKGKLSFLYEYEDYQLFYASVDSQMANIQSAGAYYNREVINTQEAKIIGYNYFGILDADYKGKYIVSMLLRRDGSSLFGVENRWANYYRVSAAYRLNEDFHIPGFQELKIRAATGTSGQRPNYTYQYSQYPVIPNQGLDFIGTISGNPKLKPANTTEYEVALDAEFLDKFEFELIRSWANTVGVFFPKALPAASGASSYWANAANTSSNTWEATLGAQLVKQDGFDWSVNLSYDRIRQKLTDFDGQMLVGPAINGTQIMLIKPNTVLGSVYGYDWVHSLDQMKNQLPTGKSISDYTVNSDGYVIEKGTEGRTTEKAILLQDQNGNPTSVKIADFNPNFNMSIFSKLSYKGLGLTMLWAWKQGGNIYNLTKQVMYNSLTSSDVDQASKPAYQRKAYDYYTNFYQGENLNSHFVEDGTYLKLRELSIYYTMNQQMFKKIGIPFIKNMKISLLGRNLLTFTKYSGWDPEVASPDPNGSGGSFYAFDIFNYPNYRTYSASLEFTF